jgi:putative holliday junction resolvase
MTSIDFPATGRLAGIDFGTVRIGVAITDASRILASPLENYNRRSLDADADYFRRLTVQEQIVGFVVGLPVHGNGRESQKSAEARIFGQCGRGRESFSGKPTFHVVDRCPKTTPDPVGCETVSD